MSVNWNKLAKTAYAALKKDGVTATIDFSRKTGEYNISTGQNATTAYSYSTHAIFKNYTTDQMSVVNPEDVEIIFHAGSTPDAIPDLMDEENITITANNKIYTIVSLQAIRPASVTIMYKARAAESGSA